MAGVHETKPDILINSPVGAPPAVYKWPLTYVSKGQKIDGAEEIVETINWVAREYPEFRPAIENLLRPSKPDLKSYDCIKNLCDKYNKILETVLKMNKGTSVAPVTSSRASQGLLKHIIEQVYNYAVKDPTELNRYSPFSSKVYGETNFEFMAQLIEKNQFRPGEDDVFIDMGSGVGHLVLQMAASVECKKCYGIEISDVPAGYAKVMEDRFKFWMDWYGKTYTEFELFFGDFFEKKYVDIIKSSNFILVNNYAFSPEVDHKLKERFLDLNDGTQILSSKPFCSPKVRVTERHLTDIGSIMRVVEIQPEQKKDSVSWTDKPLPYYRHTLDASRVQKFFERRKRRNERENRNERGNKRRRVGTKSDSEDDSDDNVVRGPTTRRAWYEQCNATSGGNRASTDSVKTASSRNNSTDTEHYESAIENEENTATIKENDVGHKRDKKNDTQSTTIDKSNASQGTSAQTRGNSNLNEKTEAKSCLDKKRDYASKKTSGANLLQSAPPSALYSISKPADSINGATSKIPNIVIKVKPPSDAKLSDEETKSSTPTDATITDEQKSSETKSNENVKKLRQRKKSNAENSEQQEQKAKPTKAPLPRLQRETTRKAQAAKNAPKPTKPTSSSSILSTATTNATTRTKKALGQTAKSTAPRAQVPSKRKPNPADRGSSLELLHTKTVESVVGSAGYFPLPAPGCEDHNLRSITDTPSLPKVIIKDLSMFISDFLGDKMIEKFTEHMRSELDTFAKKLQHPGARESLVREIERERNRHRLLIRERDELMRDTKSLTERIPRAMKVHCDDLGIKNNPKSIVGHLGALLRKHQDLMAYQLQLEAALQTNQRTMNPPAAHSNNHQPLSSSYRNATASATLDLSLKTVA